MPIWFATRQRQCYEGSCCMELFVFLPDYILLFSSDWPLGVLLFTILNQGTPRSTNASYGRQTVKPLASTRVIRIKKSKLISKSMLKYYVKYSKANVRFYSEVILHHKPQTDRHLVHVSRWIFWYSGYGFIHGYPLRACTRGWFNI